MLVSLGIRRQGPQECESLFIEPSTSFGKRSSPGIGATTSLGTPHSSSLFFIHDKASGTKFLVDTRAEVIVIPPTAQDRRQLSKSDIFLQAVNKTQIPTYGERSLTLDLGLRQTFRFIFWVADIPLPIIGADFLNEFWPRCGCFDIRDFSIPQRGS